MCRTEVLPGLSVDIDVSDRTTIQHYDCNYFLPDIQVKEHLSIIYHGQILEKASAACQNIQRTITTPDWQLSADATWSPRRTLRLESYRRPENS